MKLTLIVGTTEISVSEDDPHVESIRVDHADMQFSRLILRIIEASPDIKNPSVVIAELANQVSMFKAPKDEKIRAAWRNAVKASCEFLHTYDTTPK